jgi:hypothetical protein
LPVVICANADDAISHSASALVANSRNDLDLSIAPPSWKRTEPHD